jgi:hypothetical protein
MEPVLVMLTGRSQRICWISLWLIRYLDKDYLELRAKILIYTYVLIPVTHLSQNKFNKQVFISFCKIIIKFIFVIN